MWMTIQECSPLIHYEPAASWEEGRASGNETYSGDSYILSWHPSSTASFSFNGTGFSIFGVKGPDFGNFVVLVDGVSHTGNATDPEFKYEEPLYESEPLDNQMHNVVFIVGEGNKPVKLDFIKWTSDMGLSNTKLGNDTGGNPLGDNDDNTTQHNVIQDTDQRFMYSPQGAWNTSPQMVQSFRNQSGHSTSLSDASVTFTFNGTAISLHGSIGPAQTSSYSVSLDSMEPVWFNATRTWWDNDQVLYHASNLGPGEHTVVVRNGYKNTNAGGLSSDSVAEPSSGLIPRVWSRRSSRSRAGREEGSEAAALYDPGEHRRGRKRQASPTDGQTILGSFDLDYARVWGENLAVVTSTSATPTSTLTVSSQPTLTDSSAISRNLSTGAIAGISVASVVFVLLLAALWFLNKRNKILWRHLQKGYMVQSQFDASTPPGSRSPRQNMSAVNLLQSIPIRRGTGDVDPFPPGYEAATRHADTDGNGLYVPYAGFGHRRSNSKSSYTHLQEDSKESLPTKEGYQTYNDVENVPLPPRINEPTRSDTLMTSSTLVAEDGSFATLDGIAEDEEAPLKSAKRLNTLRPVGPPTNSTATTPTSPTPISGIRHSTRSSRRRDKAYPNSQRSKASKHTHSSSPSRDQLLGPGNHFNSDSDLNDWEYEDDISEDSEDAHDFYTSEASQGGLVAVTPLSPGARSLSARTQSELEVQTPIGRRMFDFTNHRDAPVPEVPLVRHGSSVAGMGHMESDVGIGDVSRDYLPKHQMTDDTMSTLPAYTSKRNSLT